VPSWRALGPAGSDSEIILPLLPGECVDELHQAIVEAADNAIHDRQAAPRQGWGTPELKVPERA